MSNGTITYETLATLLHGIKIATRNNVSATCPVCHKADHFFVNKLTFMWDCKKCGEAGGLRSLLFHLGRLDLLEGQVVDQNKQLKKLLTPEQENDVDLVIPTVKMPIGATLLDYDNVDNPFVIYLKSRKLRRKDFELYRPTMTDLKRKYENYALLRVERDYLLKGFIGRYILPIADDDEETLRYQNSRSEFSKLLFGYDEITNRTRSLLMVEGVYDKIGSTTELGLHYEDEFKCVGNFGKKISDAQMKLIKATKVKDIFLMFDARDAIRDMKLKAYQLKKEFRNVFVSYLYPNDPGASTKRELLDAIYKAEPPEKFWFNKLHRRTLK